MVEGATRALRTFFSVAMLAFLSRTAVTTTRAFTAATRNSRRLVGGVVRRPTPMAPGRRHRWSNRYDISSSSGIFASAYDSDDDVGDEKSVGSKFNVVGLRKEVSRLTVRCHKTIGKANGYKPAFFFNNRADK